MALNKTHENILDGYFNFIFDEISESAPPDVVLAAYGEIEVFAQMALGGDATTRLGEEFKEIRSKWASEFIRYDINEAILRILEILGHKYPQNRTKSNSDFYQQYTPGFIVFSVRRDDIADESKEVVTLKDGTLIERGSIFVQYEKEQSPEIAYLAREPEGLLSLTSRGPATRIDVINYVLTRTKLEINKAQQNSSVLFSELQSNVEYLSDGLLGDIDSKNRSLIEQSLSKLQEFARTNAALAKAILLRLSHLFYRRNELIQEENDIDYIARVLPLISEEIRVNLTKYDREFKEDEQKLAELSQQWEKLSDDINAKRVTLAEIKTQAKEQFWGEALKQEKLLISDYKSQWGALVASEANLSSTNKIFRKFLPAKEILNSIKQYKMLFVAVSQLESDSHVLQAEKFKINEKRKAQFERRAFKSQQQEWLKYLRRGDFVKADQVWLLSEAKSVESRVAKRDVLPTRGKNQYFDVNAQDEFGRNALFYALRHGNYLLAYKLAVSHEADCKGVSFRSQPDITFALNPPPGTSRYSAWTKVIEDGICQDLGNLVSGSSIESFDTLRSRYAADHSVLFSETYSKFLNKIKTNYKCFLWGNRVASESFERFKDMFTALNQKEQFTELFEEVHNRALTYLGYFLKGGNFDSITSFKEAQHKFELLGEIDFFNAKIDEHLTSLDVKLNAYLTQHGSETSGLQAIVSQYERLQAKERCQKLIQRYEKQQSGLFSNLEEKTAKPHALSSDDITNLRSFINELLASLKSLPTVRKNCFFALFHISAVNLADRRRLEQQLAEDEKNLNGPNAEEVPNELAKQINTYRQILVANEGGKTGQSRYLASLDSFLEDKHISPKDVTDQSIFKSFGSRTVCYI